MIILIPKLIADFVWSSNINPKAKLKAFPLKELIKLLIKFFDDLSIRHLITY